MVAVNELQVSMTPLTRLLIGLELDPNKAEIARQRVIAVIQFYESLLDGNSYFVNDSLTLADIVAGTLVSALPQFGLSLEAYPSLNAWLEGLEERESWQQTTLSPEIIEAALPSIRKILERRS